jgi:uncharacterized membrane protein YedE/YeeE
MMSALVSFISGVVFAVGLGIGGMTQPAKVIGFLDFAGNWDPSLAFVMLGAVGVHSLFYRMSRNRSFTRSSVAVSLPSRSQIDSRLIGGSIVFGVGWGIAGYCPGPAITSVASGNFSALIFFMAMIAGIFAFDLTRVLSARRTSAEHFAGEMTQDM